MFATDDPPVHAALGSGTHSAPRIAPGIDALRAAYGHLDGLELVRVMVETVFPGRIALVSSFGAESAVLLDLIARVDPATPVIFLDTGKLFPETLAYRTRLQELLGLTNVVSIRPQSAPLTAFDPDGVLWRHCPDACCHLRKVLPLDRALTGLDAWFTGRKRFHGATRAKLETIEEDHRRIKINPLARWSRDDVDAALAARGLPRHPLVARGFPSIGCEPCTRRVAPDDHPRAGRWAEREKTECGIHPAE